MYVPQQLPYLPKTHLTYRCTRHEQLLASLKKPFKMESKNKIDLDPALFTSLSISSANVDQQTAGAEIYLKLTDATPIYEFQSNDADGLMLSAESQATEELGLTLDSTSLQ